MKRFVSIVGALAIILAGASQAQADYIVFGSGSTSDGSVSAEADVSFGNGTVTVVLKNLQTDIKSAGQALSGFQFTVGNSIGPLGTNPITSESGNAINIVSQSQTTSVIPSPQIFGGATANWQLSNPSGNNLLLDVFKHAQPDHMVMGPANGGLYPNANGSLTNGTFWPFYQKEATFVLSVPGVTADSTLTGTPTFNFGTALGENTVDGTIIPPDGGDNSGQGTGSSGGDTGGGAPAPPTVVLFAIGSVGLGAVTWRRRRLQTV